MKINAYAKINLNLSVGEKRPDGYHSIKTLMYSLPLHDEVFVDVFEGDGISISCDAEGVPCDEKNIAYKAAKAYFRAVGMTKKVNIRIVKNIPVAGGFGGSSTDGAAVLLALHSILQNECNIYELAASLSADMPFCLAAAQKSEKSYVPVCAECTGIGEKMEFKQAFLCDVYAVICACGEGINAGQMYHLFDEDKKVKTASQYFEGVELYNDFEPIAIRLRPVIATVKQIMTVSKAEAVLMSGSGNGTFGLFKNENDAKICASALNVLGARADICKIGVQND